MNQHLISIPLVSGVEVGFPGYFFHVFEDLLASVVMFEDLGTSLFIDQTGKITHAGDFLVLGQNLGHDRLFCLRMKGEIRVIGIKLHILKPAFGVHSEIV